MHDQDLFWLLRLHRTPHIGDINGKRLVEYCGSAEGIFKSSKAQLLKIPGVGQRLINHLHSKVTALQAEEELEFMRKHNVSCAGFKDAAYPTMLNECPDAPLLLFFRGQPHWEVHPVISVVGTRNISKRGIAFCERLIESISVFNPIVVSGFAYGTDITAHTSAINQNLSTVAVLAHGMDQLYPRSHSKYVKEILGVGGFVTDFWSTDSFERSNFLKRNRIIAGLSEATIVIESAEKGGSLVTANLAGNYNREVFAVPGRPEDRMSRGCNNLIKTHRAHMLTDPADLPFILGWNIDKIDKPVKPQPQLTLDANAMTLYEFIASKGLVELDQIAVGLGWNMQQLTAKLVEMEMDGIVRALPGKQYEII